MAMLAGLRTLPGFQDIQQNQQVQNTDDPRKVPDTHAPRMPPIFCSWGKSRLTVDTANAMATANPSTIVAWAEREKESDTERLLALLQHESHAVIDSSDVIRIERMAQAEHVGGEPKADQGRIARCVVQIQSHPSKCRPSTTPYSPTRRSHSEGEKNPRPALRQRQCPHL